MAKTCETCTKFAPITLVERHKRTPMGRGSCTLDGGLSPKSDHDGCRRYSPTFRQRVDNLFEGLIALVH